MRVHITLRTGTDGQQDSAVQHQLEDAGVQRVDLKYLHKYGIVAGELDQQAVGAVQALPMVQAVEPVGVVSAI